MTMDFKHDEQGVLMQYGAGDPCPPGQSSQHEQVLAS